MKKVFFWTERRRRDLLAEALNVNKDVAAEGAPVVPGEARGADDGLGVVAVDVQHRRRHRLGHVAAVARGAAALRRRRVPHLAALHRSPATLKKANC